MKKLTLYLLVVATLCHSKLIFSANHWAGYYLGGNAGFWWSQNNKVSSTGSPSFINQTYLPGATNVANVLAQMASTSSSLNPYGFMLGAQGGYNYEFNNKYIVGYTIDFDGLTNSNNNITLRKTASLADFDESYAGSLAVKQRINYLGTVRARLGYLYDPTILIYASGGFTFANVTVNTTWTAQESLGTTVFPAINERNNQNNTLTGWMAGAGVEWFYKPNWSSMLEFAYYSLNDFNVPATLTQTNASLSPPVLWASAAANTALSLSFWSIKFGLNYHFC